MREWPNQPINWDQRLEEAQEWFCRYPECFFMHGRFTRELNI